MIQKKITIQIHQVMEENIVPIHAIIEEIIPVQGQGHIPNTKIPQDIDIQIIKKKKRVVSIIIITIVDTDIIKEIMIGTIQVTEEVKIDIKIMKKNI